MNRYKKRERNINKIIRNIPNFHYIFHQTAQKNLPLLSAACTKNVAALERLNVRDMCGWDRVQRRRWEQKMNISTEQEKQQWKLYKRRAPPMRLTTPSRGLYPYWLPTHRFYPRASRTYSQFSIKSVLIK